MTFDEYAHSAALLDRDPDGPLWYPCLGLSGELGEVIEHVKKHYRDGKEIPGEVMLELGDILWYLTTLTKRLGYTLEEVAAANLTKLQHRAVHGKEVTV
jgi:NTP pyrophosphatase (non-canonical NTP hydrolase)